jgi:DNA-binding response OmpR family regulator
MEPVLNTQPSENITRILLAEDDAKLASLVKSYLDQNGFDVFIESNGSNVAEQIARVKPDLLILDLMLPGKDGLSICREIRDSFTGAILILTAKQQDYDQVLGLELGADDYVIKPVEPPVLLARIKALLRRCNTAAIKETRNTLVFGKLCINESSRSVSIDSIDIDISTNEFDMLWLLANHAGTILSRDYLYQELYGRPYDGLDRTIDVRTSHLRKKLGDTSNPPKSIKTIWGKGYIFIADYWISESDQ